jgi:hypothetical protein
MRIMLRCFLGTFPQRIHVQELAIVRMARPLAGSRSPTLPLLAYPVQATRHNRHLE